MKKVLVTGGSGFIAYHVIENLIKSNFNVTGVDLVDPKNKKLGFIDLGNHILIAGIVLIGIFIITNA